MSRSADVIVIGLGGIGSAAAYHLARRGLRVLGLDQFPHAHARGSSHGDSRLIRQAYFEHPAYVPLLRRAYQLWEDLEAQSGERLFFKNGLVLSGPDVEGAAVHGAKRSAEMHGIAIEEMSADLAKRRWPMFNFDPSHSAVYEPGAGFLRVEACVRAHLAGAEAASAELRNEGVKSWKRTDSGVEVTTEAGTYAAERLVIAGGAWSSDLLSTLQDRLSVHRVPLLWLARAKDEALRLEDGVPCFGFDLEEGFFYGFPALPSAIAPRRGVKVALHAPGERVFDPAHPDRTLQHDERALLVKLARRCLPDATDVVLDYAVCMYTMTLDEHFILDTDGPVSFFAGGSGHAFKFASVLGEMLADFAQQGATQQPVDFLRLSRF